MKTREHSKFFQGLGITTTDINADKGIIQTPYMHAMLLAVSDTPEAQESAVHRFREATHQNNTLMASVLPLSSPGGSTIVPGVDCRVPVFTMFAGRLDADFGTCGNLITSSRALHLLKEMELKAKGKRGDKTPYLKWLCDCLGVTRPTTVKELQDLVIEASRHPEAASIPALSQLLLGRGTRSAVLTVGSKVEFRDTEPTINESDWIFVDLERLVTGGITDTQASVLRKTSQVFESVLNTVPAEPIKNDSFNLSAMVSGLVA